MDKIIESFLLEVFNEDAWAVVKLADLKIKETTHDVILARKRGEGDFFMFIEVPPNHLHEVNKFLQIDLMHEVESAMFSGNRQNINVTDERFLAYVEPIILTKNYNQDTNLIITTSCEDNDQYTLQSIVDIEENEFFFKKHVIRKSAGLSQFIHFLMANLNGESLVSKLNLAVNDNDSYVKFIAGNGDKSFKYAAHLFEKLPFLSLNVKKSTRKLLIESIKKEIKNNDIDLDLIQGVIDINQSKDLFLDEYEKWKLEVLNAE
ncbi:ABC-three component system middle component 1 [uncultured Erwinia sp.]|uniref:ABC-three component system middle component 1 n=1 Tax=uncultured Erwinia sp. TaxID=246798 RepID=UPI002590AC54|nr:ABC-three component system middle component 1 [uncultured Erwinia sp.]